jgi:hypothetical protein
LADIHPVNLSRGHGSSIHEVFGRGSSPASTTVSQPSGNRIDRSFPLRAILGPKHGSESAVHALGLSVDSRSAGGGIQAHAEPALTQDLEHHVDVVARQSAALGEHLSLLRQNIEIEPNPVPGKDGAAEGDLVLKVTDQIGSLLAVHSVGRTGSVATVPEDRFGPGDQRGGAGDAQRTAGSPVFPGGAGGFDVEGEVAAFCGHHS